MGITRDKRWQQVDARLRRNVEDAVAASALMLQRAIKSELSRGKTRNSGHASEGAPPNMMTGNLRRSIQVDMSRLRQQPVSRARVGTNVVYGRILEYGGMIVPKSAKALVVPVSFAAATELRRAGGNVRAVPGLSMVFRKRGAPLLVRKWGKGTRGKTAWIPMFVLLKHVVIRAHPYMRPASAKTIPAILDRFKTKTLLNFATVKHSK